jgi:hypothetical protein
MIWRLLETLAQRHDAKRCRACGKPILTDDGFGRSEEICAPCRS